LSILLLRLSQVLLGSSLLAIRLLPALAGAATVCITGDLRREQADARGRLRSAAQRSLCALFNLAAAISDESREARVCGRSLFCWSGLSMVARTPFGLVCVCWTPARKQTFTAFLAAGIFIALTAHAGAPSFR